MAIADEIAQFRVLTQRDVTGNIVGQKFQYRSRETVLNLGVFVVSTVFSQWRDFGEAEEVV